MSEFMSLDHSFESVEDAEMYILERETHLAIDRYFREYQFDYIMESETVDDAKKQMRSAGNKMVGTIEKAFQSILNMLRSIGEKIRSFFTGGSKPEVSDPNKEVHFDSDPKERMKLTDDFVDEDERALDRALKGDLTIDEAKEIAANHRRAFENLKPYVATAAVIAVPFVAHRLKIDQWSKQLNQSMKKNSDLINEIAKRNAYAEDNGQIKDNRAEAAQIIINDIATTTGSSSNFILKGLQELYVKHEVRKQMEGLEASKETKKGGRIYRRDQRAEARATKKKTKELKEKDATIQTNEKRNARVDRRLDKQREKLGVQRDKMYDRSLGISDKERKRMDAEESERQKKEAKERILNDVRDHASQVRSEYEERHPEAREKREKEHETEYDRKMRIINRARDL